MKFNLRFLCAFCLALLVTALAVATQQVGEAVPFGVMAATAPFVIDPDLQAVAIAYRNQNLIADEVLPRVPVGSDKYKYWSWDKEQGFTIPDTHVGRKGRVNQVEFSATEKKGAVEDYGLEDPIPQKDIDNAPAGIDPRGRATEGLTDLILLDREVRTANLVFNAATYPAGHKETLAGNAQFSDFANSDPIGVISDALDKPLVRPNVMTLGQAVWTKLRRHPAIVKAMHGSAGDSGMATRQFVADLFELEELLVGPAFLNTAKKGQNANFARVWGKHIALTFRDRLANPTQSGNRLTFGFTAQHGDRVAGSMPDKNIGLRGGQVVRVGESVDEHIVAADAAYFIENAIA